jgi:predicted AAA+ superfamily ATPase
MSFADLFERLVRDGWARPAPELVDRDVSLRAIPGKVDAVIGMRRTGKTSLLRSHLAARIRAGAPIEDHVFLTFEDERLAELTAADLHLLPEAVLRLDPRSYEQKRWYYLDEIQAVAGWERFVRRLLDEPGNQIAISGSSAKMLSQEVATSLRGRGLPLEVTPLSFRESLRWHGETIAERSPGSREQARMEHAFERYLQLGGFPEVQGMEAQERLLTLQEYVRVAVLRDLVERHAVANTLAARTVVRRLLAAPGSLFSVNKVTADLRSLGIAAGRELVTALVGHAEDAFLVATVALDTESEHRRQVNPRKVYPADPSLHTAMNTGRGGNRGHLLETIVYWELRRRGWELGWVKTRGGYEVDFVARRPDREPKLVQVCWDVSPPDTREREVRALAAASVEIGVRDCTIVTALEEGRVELPGSSIGIVPAWAWCLDL